MTQRRDEVFPDYALITLKSALAAIRLDVAFKPLVKVLASQDANLFSLVFKLWLDGTMSQWNPPSPREAVLWQVEHRPRRTRSYYS